MQSYTPRYMILDVGAGSGSSLFEELRQRELRGSGTPEAMMIGIDIDREALRTAKSSHPQFHFVCARGEQLPFRTNSFSEVISRVAMPYMNIPITLRELRRVLMTPGELRIKLHPLSFTCAELLAELKSGSLRQRLQNLIYRLYVILNGLALHVAGFNFHFPFRRRCESFQTRRGIERALLAAGFNSIDSSCWVTTIVPPHAGNCRVTAK